MCQRAGVCVWRERDAADGRVWHVFVLPAYRAAFWTLQSLEVIRTSTEPKQ